MVERFVRDEEAAGSNPVTSTTLNSIQLIWMLFFHVCINFSSGFEPAFHRAASRNHAEGVCFESCHLDLVAVDVVSLAATFSKSLLAHFVTAPLPTRPAALGSCRSLLQHSVNLNAVFSFLHKFFVRIRTCFSSRREPNSHKRHFCESGVFPHCQHTKPMFFLIVIYRDVGKSGFFQKS